MYITIILFTSAIFFVAGFKCAEYVLKSKSNLKDQEGNDLDKS